MDDKPRSHIPTSHSAFAPEPVERGEEEVKGRSGFLTASYYQSA